MTCGIYCITNTVTGDRYIGQSWNIEDRWTRHVYALKTGKHSSKRLVEDWSKYGCDAFNLEILEVCSIHSRLEPIEMKWIVKFNPSYNVDPFRVKQRKRMSELMAEKWKNKLR